MFEARNYQLELADYLMDHNGILYLPTGSGKTFISILVLKRLSHQLLKYEFQEFTYLARYYSESVECIKLTLILLIY